MSRYESHNLKNQELPFIYREASIRATNNRLGSSNWHENIELLYIAQGEGVISNNGHIIPVSTHSIVVINANHLHALAAGSENMVHRYLIVDRSFCMENGIDTNLISFESCIDDERVRTCMEELHEIYAQSPDTSYRTLAIRALILRLMLLLCKEHATPTEHTARPDRSAAYVKQAIDFVHASYDRDFSLDDAAAFVGVNKCYLSREFHKYTGYPFVSYVNRTRCKIAQQLLADDRLSIYEVAKKCGFENRSYFAKSFQRYIGVLPSTYREQLSKPQI